MSTLKGLSYLDFARGINFKFFQLIIVIVLLAGCATRPLMPTTSVTTNKEPGTWEKRDAQLSAIKNWSLSSALSVRHANQVNFVSLNWQQQGRQFSQTISGPFNLGGVKITGRPGKVVLWKTSQNKITASTPEELFYKELNLNLPISNMFYWVRGLPAPNQITKQQFDSQKQLVMLNQNGWTINYQTYQQINGIALPNKMLLSNGDIQVKMVIKSWQLN